MPTPSTSKTLICTSDACIQSGVCDILPVNVSCLEPVVLVKQVYRAAPMEIQRKILNTVVRQLGILSLVAVANGIFARAAIQWPQAAPNIPLDQVPSIKIEDVWELLDFAYQVSSDVFDGLTQLIVASPKIANTASGLLLVAWIAKRRKYRHFE